MGNSAQKHKNQQIPILVNHPNFKNVRLVSDQARKYLQLSIGVQLTQYQKWTQKLINSKLNSPTLLLPISQQFSRKGLCSDSGTLKLHFENYVFILSDQIKNRKQRFKECQLWYLLLNLSQAQNQMKTKAVQKVGDIRPQNIFLNQNSDIKISNLYSWPRENTNYIKTLENEKTYLAPQDLQKLKQGNMEDTLNFSSEVFSIGLTVLSSAMLQDFFVLYDIKNLEFNRKQAECFYSEWIHNEIYSQIFTATVLNLCSLDPNKRLDENQLWNWLSKYQKQIESKKDFMIYSVPSKIEQSIHELRSFLVRDINEIPAPKLKQKQSSQKSLNDQSYVQPYTSEIHGFSDKNQVQRQKLLENQNLAFHNQMLPIVKDLIPNQYNVISKVMPQDLARQQNKMINYVPFPSPNPKQMQLISQYTKKVDREKSFTQHFNNKYQNSSFNQLHLPVDKQREQAIVQGQDLQSQKLKYFQKIIYPETQGRGKIQQTVYIPRPKTAYQKQLKEWK